MFSWIEIFIVFYIIFTYNAQHLVSKRSQFLDKALTNKCVCLKLDEGSEPFKQFSEFWPILTTPIVYFINGGGAKIAEPLVGDVTEKDILQAIHPVMHNAPSTSTQPSTTTVRQLSLQKLQ